jgi:hypothetical protein
MSVGMRWPVPDTKGCICRQPYFEGQEPNCVHEFVTDFGVVEHPLPRPDRGEVGPLILADHEWVEFSCGRRPALLAFRDTEVSFTRRDGRTFLHCDYPVSGDNPRRWTWELFEAHWEPDSPHQDNRPMLIGRWPD